MAIHRPSRYGAPKTAPDGKGQPRFSNLFVFVCFCFSANQSHSWIQQAQLWYDASDPWSRVLQQLELKHLPHPPKKDLTLHHTSSNGNSNRNSNSVNGNGNGNSDSSIDSILPGNSSTPKMRPTLSHLSNYLQAVISHVNCDISNLICTVPASCILGSEEQQGMPKSNVGVGAEQGGEATDSSSFFEAHAPTIVVRSIQQKGFHFGSVLFKVAVPSATARLMVVASPPRSQQDLSLTSPSRAPNHAVDEILLSDAATGVDERIECYELGRVGEAHLRVHARMNPRFRLSKSRTNQQSNRQSEQERESRRLFIMKNVLGLNLAPHLLQKMPVSVADITDRTLNTIAAHVSSVDAFVGLDQLSAVLLQSRCNVRHRRPSQSDLPNSGGTETGRKGHTTEAGPPSSVLSLTVDKTSLIFMLAHPTAQQLLTTPRNHQIAKSGNQVQVATLTNFDQNRLQSPDFKTHNESNSKITTREDEDVEEKDKDEEEEDTIELITTRDSKIFEGMSRASFAQIDLCDVMVQAHIVAELKSELGRGTTTEQLSAPTTTISAHSAPASPRGSKERGQQNELVRQSIRARNRSPQPRSNQTLLVERKQQQQQQQKTEPIVEARINGVKSSSRVIQFISAGTLRLTHHHADDNAKATTSNLTWVELHNIGAILIQPQQINSTPPETTVWVNDIRCVLHTPSLGLLIADAGCVQNQIPVTPLHLLSPSTWRQKPPLRLRVDVSSITVEVPTPLHTLLATVRNIQLQSGWLSGPENSLHSSGVSDGPMEMASLRVQRVQARLVDKQGGGAVPVLHDMCHLAPPSSFNTPDTLSSHRRTQVGGELSLFLCAHLPPFLEKPVRQSSSTAVDCPAVDKKDDVGISTTSVKPQTARRLFADGTAMPPWTGARVDTLADEFCCMRANKRGENID
jgi:hypothetical protein